VRLVLNLEKMVVKEAQRAFTYLSLYDYLVDLVVVNRVLPPEVTDEYFTSWRAAQNRYNELVENAFSPVPIMRTKLFDHEVVGLEHLGAMADSIFGDGDPTQIYYHSVPQRITKKGNDYELMLHLPFVGKDEIELTHREDELFVTVGPYKREISLPRSLRGRVTRGARLDEGTLHVTFGSAKS
jgi:arsenite-transporting ATPase